ncbi:MAG: hypothetical protein Q9181_000199 [Wetmoreana brouardii]
MFLSRYLFSRNNDYICQQCRTFSSSRIIKAGDRHLPRQLPSSPARTRFAPSPTGYLHLGSLRTALFNYLIAKATGGQFLLRVEDTDTKLSADLAKKRTVADAEERLYSDLKWAGLQWDEGPDIGGPYGPYKQSQRTALYQQHAEQLLQSNHAYRCFCSSEKLNELAQRRAKLGLPSDYDRTCEGLPVPQSDERASTGEAFVIRLRVPPEAPEYIDLVYGPVGKPNHSRKAYNLGEALYEDPILLKSNGLPTYHLANVVDDHHMRITHVVRAVEWMSSTPKHLTLYKALGWKAPEFAHVGLLQDSSRQKFSKRKGDLDIRKFADEGIFPEALLNYVALFGWSHTNKSDVFSLSDLTRSFDLKFTKGNTVVEPHKLIYLQKKHAAKHISEGGREFQIIVDRVFEAIRQEFENPVWNHPLKSYRGHLSGDELRSLIASVLQYTAKNYTTPKAFFDNYKYLFYNEPLPYFGLNTKLIEMHATCASLWPHLRLVNSNLRQVPHEEWTDGVINEKTQEIISEVKFALQRDCDESDRIDEKAVYKSISSYLRLAVARGGSGPPMHTTMALLGREVSLKRLEELADSLAAQFPEQPES